MYNKPITLARVREMLGYDEKTGVFRWRERPYRNSRRKPGDVAGRTLKTGFRYIGIDGGQYLASRLAWFYTKGEWPERKLTFVDGNVDNNAIANLAYNEFDHSPDGKRAYQREYRKRNFEVFRASDLRKDFGMKLDVYQSLFVAQGGVCAICKNPETESRRGRQKWLAVDHCHDTYVVRGLLCAACNTAIGRMGDDPARLRAAADYIEKAREAPSEDANVIRLIPRKAG